MKCNHFHRPYLTCICPTLLVKVHSVSYTAEPLTYCDCQVLDGAAEVHFLPVTGVVILMTMHRMFLFLKQLQSSKRIDVVWDTYLTYSLKESTREKRGKGVHRKVSGQTKVPSKWMDFLCDPKNRIVCFSNRQNLKIYISINQTSICHIGTACSA